MYFDKNFRRECTNNTASENKIDQFLQEFEINKQQQLYNDLKKNPQKQLKPNPEDDQKKMEEQKALVKPNEALDRILKAIKIESKTSKCIEMLKTLFKSHVRELHPAHILETVYQLIDIPLNYRKQDDLKYLIVILNIIIEARDHCILREYGHFYKIIDTFRVNLLLFKDDTFQFQANMKKINEHLTKYYEQTNYFQSLNFEEPPSTLPPAEEKQIQQPEVQAAQKVADANEQTNQQVEDKQEKVEEPSSVSAIREKLMKKKLEKIQQKEEEKLQKQQQQIPQQEEQIEPASQQIKLIKKDEIPQEITSKVDYEYTLSENLQNILASKLSQYYFQRKLLVKALLSMKFLLHREWSKITVTTVINDVFMNQRGMFSEEDQKKIDDFMSELQNIKASDSMKVTQRNIQESSIISNASNSKFDVKKMTMGAKNGAGDGLNAWASKQNGL